jgi:hypothetical protein
MTNAELIALLQELPPDLDVYFEDGYGTHYNFEVVPTKKMDGSWYRIILTREI